LFQSQATWHRPILPGFDQRQEWPFLRGKRHIPPARAAQRAGGALLVGDRLRPRDTRAAPRPGAVEHRFNDAGIAEERRRLGGRLLRREGTRSQGVELGAHARRKAIRTDVPLLRSAEAALRQELAAAGLRESEMTREIGARD